MSADIVRVFMNSAKKNSARIAATSTRCGTADQFALGLDDVEGRAPNSAVIAITKTMKGTKPRRIKCSARLPPPWLVTCRGDIEPVISATVTMSCLARPRRIIWALAGAKERSGYFETRGPPRA